MRKLGRIAVLVLVNAIVLAVFLEIGANIFFFAEYGHPFYTSERLQIKEATRELNPFMSGAVHAAIHPYFGFVYKLYPGGEAKLSHVKFNNHGFLFSPAYASQESKWCCDYQSSRSSDDELFVGIFGGSVAAALAYRMQENSALVEAFRAIPRFAGKRIRILQFAMGGYKQPQQLMVLAYYLALGQPLDVIINVDGFNELLSGAGLLSSDMEVAYPDVSTYGQLIDFIERQTQGARTPDDVLVTYHAMMERQWARRANSCWIATCYALATLIRHWHHAGSVGTAPAAPATTKSTFFFQINKTSVHIPNMREKVEGRTAVTSRLAYDLVADHWMRTSYLMQQLVRGQNMIYMHVLQPNQWFRRSTPYVPRDESTAYLNKVVPIGYSALIARVPQLRKLGVNLLDTSAIFDNQANGIYSDDIGHFTPDGNDLLAHAIISALAAPDLH